MPNHCHTDVWLSGTKADVDALLALVGADKPEPEFSCEAVVPYPDNFKQQDEEWRTLCKSTDSCFSFLPQDQRDTPEALAFLAKYGKLSDGFNNGGYEWKREHWGTKWGAYDVARRDYEGVCITFQTAWSSPRPVLVALAKRFPKVTVSVEWFEMGVGECGGYSLLADDEYLDESEVAGQVCREWGGKYNGRRGG